MWCTACSNGANSPRTELDIIHHFCYKVSRGFRQCSFHTQKESGDEKVSRSHQSKSVYSASRRTSRHICFFCVPDFHGEYPGRECRCGKNQHEGTLLVSLR